MIARLREVAVGDSFGLSFMLVALAGFEATVGFGFRAPASGLGDYTISYPLISYLLADLVLAYSKRRD